MKSLLKSQTKSEARSEAKIAATVTDGLPPLPAAGPSRFRTWMPGVLVAGSLTLAGLMLLQPEHNLPTTQQRSLLGIAGTQPPEKTSKLQPGARSPEPQAAPAQRPVVQTSPRPSLPKLVTPAQLKPLLGSYIGYFHQDAVSDPDGHSESLQINLAIDAIQNGQIVGHSLIAGINHPFVGTLRPQSDGRFSVQAREAGARRGIYRFQLEASGAVGKWQGPGAGRADVREYELYHRVFRYDPRAALNDFNRPYDDYAVTTQDEQSKQEGISADVARYNASVIRLTGAMIENFYRSDLEVLRNSIYARHGYAFQNPLMRRYFASYDWYMPVSQDVSAELTELEKQNIALIQRYERHATRYYDHFGR